MTFEELMQMPKGYNLQTWQKELNRRKQIRKKIYKLSEERDALEDALEVLKGEETSERYKQKADKLAAVYKKISELNEKLDK